MSSFDLCIPETCSIDRSIFKHRPSLAANRCLYCPFRRRDYCSFDSRCQMANLVLYNLHTLRLRGWDDWIWWTSNNVGRRAQFPELYNSNRLVGPKTWKDFADRIQCPSTSCFQYALPLLRCSSLRQFTWSCILREFKLFPRFFSWVNLATKKFNSQNYSTGRQVTILAETVLHCHYRMRYCLSSFASCRRCYVIKQ